MASLVLYQFRYSPYNEKVRWALDVKGVAHKRRTLLPGPHMRLVSRISGQTQTPVLVADGRVVAGSAGILDELDRLYPVPALTPAFACAAREAYEAERRFDAVFIPRMRRALLARLLEHPNYLCRVFGGDHGIGARLAYRGMLPLAGGLIRAGNGIEGPASIADGEQAIAEALDYVAATRAGRPYLVGTEFSRADIAAASAIAAVTNPAGTPMELPAPMPGELSDWIGQWSDHPSAEWAAGLLRTHRHAMAATPQGQEDTASAVSAAG